jgi:hypothetical protein
LKEATKAAGVVALVPSETPPLVSADITAAFVNGLQQAPALFVYVAPLWHLNGLAEIDLIQNPHNRLAGPTKLTDLAGG